jgi:hypothetical protein
LLRRPYQKKNERQQFPLNPQNRLTNTAAHLNAAISKKSQKEQRVVSRSKGSLKKRNPIKNEQNNVKPDQVQIE